MVAAHRPLRRRWRAQALRLWLNRPLTVAAALLAGWAVAVLAASLASTTRAQEIGWPLIASGVALALTVELMRLHRLAFEQPAPAELIADLLACQPQPVRDRVVARHAVWREWAPSRLLTIAAVEAWCRESVNEMAGTVPVASAREAAATQDRAFIPS